MRYGNKKINSVVPILILIVSAGISFCVYLLISEIVNQAGSSHILTKEERAAIGKKQP